MIQAADQTDGHLQCNPAETQKMSAKARTVRLFHMRDFLFSLCSSHWSDVGKAQFKKGDIMYFHAQIRTDQDLIAKSVVFLC